MMKSFVALSTMAVLCLGLSTQASAQERLSVKDWAQSWSDKASKKNIPFSTADLEKKALGSCSDCDNKDALTNGRKLFAKGQFDEAIRTYNQIPRGNTYWLSSVEEKGWAYFRQENYEKALAQTKTLLAPQFAEISNSEAFLLQSLTQLKICDYKGVFETHQIFKEKQKKRILEVQQLAQSGWNEALTQVLKKADKFPLTLDDMGGAVQRLPLLIYKDVEFQKQALRFKASERALAMVDSSRVKDQLEKANTQSFLALKKRVQELAQEETNENFNVIQKLNLVEVEAIQRVHTDMELADSMYKKSQFEKVGDDKLVFMDDGRPWIDELDKFEVAAKTCAKGIRRKM
ncbi:MAG: hypothetical protein OM95_16605 [Bdellovibrio sp. ArHS]|uniref:hypothetical protein n=1 Tax=Bdellovibrio sp. ArHS TaxID=1569284 RepID=UPI0005827D19|nr:hypothetical protein [Bdellovibrio sp. ArHS]KHD87045.1 MAG: hypothetical protein OM95_16605 [Bdellovibrio sp. ArHS]